MKKPTRTSDTRDSCDTREQGHQGKPDEAQPPKLKSEFLHTVLPNGRVKIFALLGEFDSLEEGKRAARQTMSDLGAWCAWLQFEYEITHSKDLGDETLEQMLEANLLEQCDQVAADLGTTELWRESKTWPNFKRAWRKWFAAWLNWLVGNRRFPETKGVAKTRYLWEQKQFLAALRIGRGDKPEFYKNHSHLLFCAARLGDVEFFNLFAQTKRRKIKPGKVEDCLIQTWMPAAHWSANDVAYSDFILKQCHLRHGTKASVRTAWHNLNLWHSPEPIIRGWQFPNEQNQLSHPKALFYPKRRPKV